MYLRTGALALFLAAVALADSTAGVSWTVPQGWKAQPQRPMRAATYMIAPAAGDSEEAEVGVFYFGPGQGGDVDANIARWIGQFQASGAKPAPKKQTINGLEVTTVEHAGVYLAGGPMSPNKTPKAGFRLIGAIVAAPEGNVFFKLTGPAKTVGAAQAAFHQMLKSLKK